MKKTKTAEELLAEILKEIENTKSRGGHYVYRINEKISNSSVDYISRYFKNMPGYTFDSKKCMSCKGTWDLMITIL